MSKCKTTIITFEEFTDDDFKKPSNFWVKDAMGDYCFFHCRERSAAQDICNERYGVGRYTVNASKMQKNSGTNTVRGTLNSKSRQGHKTRGK